VWGGWLDPDALGVSELFRSQGYGAKLLEAAEDKARDQGWHGAYLTKSSFQARPFYEKFGYELVANIPDYPNGHSYYVLKKTLESGGSYFGRFTNGPYKVRGEPWLRCTSGIGISFRDGPRRHRTRRCRRGPGSGPYSPDRPGSQPA